MFSKNVKIFSHINGRNLVTNTRNDIALFEKNYVPI